MLPYPADARIRRLQLATPHEYRNEVRAALDEIDWGALKRPEEVLILRRVQAAGPLHHVAHNAFDAARALASAAVDGWSTRAADATAVSFVSRASMTACLVRDLTRGEAQTRWFWRSFADLFRAPRSQAVARALATEPLALPDVFVRLSRTPEWRLLWEALGESGATHLLSAIAYATGWPVNRTPPDGPPSRIPDPPEITLPDVWRIGLGRDLPNAPKRVRLALVFRAWIESPRLLVDAPRVLASAIDAQRISDTMRTPGNTRSSAPPRETGRDVHHVQPPSVPHAADPLELRFAGEELTRSGAPAPVRDSADRVTGDEARTTQPTDEFPLPPSPRRRVGPDLADRAPPLAPCSFTGADQVEIKAPAPSEPTPDTHPSLVPDEHSFHTRCGGWFYWLNGLALSSVQRDLARHPQVSGWAWVFGVGRTLGMQPDSPLTAFFADELGVDAALALDELELPPDVARVTRAIERRFGDAAVARALAERDAHVTVTGAHVDVHYFANDADVDIRRAALDVDPGWLPWLGRVVHFHYDRPGPPFRETPG